MNARDLSPKTHHTIKSVVADDLPVGLSHRPGDGNVVSFLHCMNDPQPEGRMASHIERRKFLATLGAAISWPLAARAQQAAKIPRVGLLSTFSPSETRPWHQALRQGLRDLGWVEGENISIEYRYAEGRLDRLPAIATDLVRLKVDLIFTDTTSPALAAKNATRSIPIVVASASDFVETGLAQSLARFPDMEESHTARKT